MDELTPLQRRVLAAIRHRSERGEPPPTYRDLCAEFGWASTGTARDHLRALARKGHLELGDGQARKLRLTEPPRPSAVAVRVLGEVAAGTPVAVGGIDMGVIPAPCAWGPASKLFAMKVCGESLRDSGILDGDVVVVHRQRDAGDGDIVVAILDGATTLKRLRIDSARAVLMPENSDSSPIPADDLGVTVQGVVVGLMRTMADDSVAHASCVLRSSNAVSEKQ